MALQKYIVESIIEAIFQSLKIKRGESSLISSLLKRSHTIKMKMKHQLSHHAIQMRRVRNSPLQTVELNIPDNEKIKKYCLQSHLTSMTTISTVVF